jgi:hypothetical protein
MDAIQIAQAGQNVFAVEESVGSAGGDADFDDMMVRVEALQVLGANDPIQADVALNTGAVAGRFAEVLGFEYVHNGQGFALTRAEDRDQFVNIDRVQFLDQELSEYALRGSYTPTIEFAASQNGRQTSAKPVFYTGEASLNLHYQLIDLSANMEVGGSRLNDFIALQGEGNKSVSGGLGDDVMDGGKGAAVLSGGLGRDNFFLDGRTLGSAQTTVTDFQVGQDRVTVWGWQSGLSRAMAYETVDTNLGVTDLTLYFDNLLSNQDAEDISEDTYEGNQLAMTLRGVSLSDFGVSGVTGVRELNAQIASGSQAHFQTGTTVDVYGEHGYLFLA